MDGKAKVLEQDITQKMGSFVSSLRRAFQSRKVYALVGKSGTGKSFRAKMVAEQYHIDAILDDGLLIVNDKVAAGKTAKKERYYLQAVKVALYDNLDHRSEVITALEGNELQRILVLGTSEKMIKKIVLHLGLPDVSKFIRIEDIATPKEIEAALKSRSEGNHIIPVPAVELKRSIPHIILDSIRIFPRNWGFWPRKRKYGVVEKTLVRPQFKDNMKGPMEIKEKAFVQIVMGLIKEFDSSIVPIKVRASLDRARVYMVKLQVNVPQKKEFVGRLHELRAYLMRNIENSTGLLVSDVHIMVNQMAKEKKSKNEKK